MSPEKKKEFIRELVANVEGELIAAVERMPEEWDGIELRQYIADKFSHVVFAGSMSRTRKRDYQNTVLVQNL